MARQQHYREYLVHLCPKLRFLDFQLVKEAERKQAARFFKSAAGKKLLEEVRPSTEEEVLSASQDERAAPSLAPAIAKRKKRALDRALSHAERRGVKADRKKLRKCARSAAKDVY